MFWNVTSTLDLDHGGSFRDLRKFAIDVGLDFDRCTLKLFFCRAAHRVVQRRDDLEPRRRSLQRDAQDLQRALFSERFRQTNVRSPHVTFAEKFNAVGLNRVTNDERKTSSGSAETLQTSLGWPQRTGDCSRAWQVGDSRFCRSTRQTRTLQHSLGDPTRTTATAHSIRRLSCERRSRCRRASVGECRRDKRATR